MLGERVYQAHCASPAGEGEPNWQSPREDGTYPVLSHDSSGHTWHHSVLVEIIRRGGTQCTDARGFARGCPPGVVG